MGRLGTCGLSALLFKGPKGPGRDGGRGAPLPAGLCPPDILRGAVGLGGGDLKNQEMLTAKNQENYTHYCWKSTLKTPKGIVFHHLFFHRKIWVRSMVTHGPSMKLLKLTPNHLTRPVRCLQHSHQILSQLSDRSFTGTVLHSSSSHGPHSAAAGLKDTSKSPRMPGVMI